MRENYWVNAFTNAEIHVHCPAGSPRAWVLKSLGAPQGELYIQPGSLYPKSVAIAGLWVRDGARLPDMGEYKTLYRFFDLPDNLARPASKKNNIQAYIGMCSCVPEHEIIKWIRAFKETGCKWLWWAKPEPEPAIRTVVSLKQRHDHEHYYTLFDQGLDALGLVDKLGISKHTARYIYKKWLQKKSAQHIDVSPLTDEDIDNIRGDLVAGELTQQEIADRYGTTRATVNKWAKRFGLSKRSTPDVKAQATGNS